MSLLKQAMQRAGISSYDALAQRLCERYPKENGLSPRSLGAKLGLIDKGDLNWWLKRPDLVEKLADALGTTPGDIGIHVGAKVRTLYVFDDFPELPPIDFQRDEICELGAFAGGDGDPERALEYWFGLQTANRRRGPESQGVTWLYFPQGTGLSFFWARLKAHTPHECLVTDSVSSVSERLKQTKSICLSVSDSKGALDLQALVKKSGKCAVLVCAPFELETRKGANLYEVFSDQYQKGSREERTLLELTNPSGSYFEGGIARYRWALGKGWQARLMRWVEDRISKSDSLLDAKQLEKWLDDMSSKELFESPADIIALCRFAHRFGCRSLPRVGERDIGAQLLNLLSDVPQSQRENFQVLVRVVLLNLELPWGGWIEARRWRELVRSSNDLSSAQDLVKAMVLEQDETKRARIAEQALPYIEGDQRVFIDPQFVMQNERASSRLRPRFLVDLIATDVLVDLIVDGDHQDWGGLYFDEMRRELVDKALGWLSIEELDHVAKGIAESRLGDVAGIGAAEAVFCAYGLRHPSDKNIPSHIKRVGKTVLNRLAQENAELPQAWTSISLDSHKWKACCWAWSLMPNIAESLPSAWSAFFPGWFADTGLIEWEWGWEPPSQRLGVFLEDLSPSEKCLLVSAKHVAASLDISGTSTYVPDSLIPYLIVKNVINQREVPDFWWETILNNGWAQDVLVVELRAVAEPLTPWLVSLIETGVQWSHKGDGTEKNKSNNLSLNLFLSAGTGLRRHLFEQSEPSSLIEGLSHDGVLLLRGYFTYLPNHFQVALLDWMCSNPTDRPYWLDIVERITPELANAVVPWLDLPVDGWMVAKWLWAYAPGKALDLVEGLGSLAARSRLIEAQSGYKDLDRVLSVIERDEDIRASLDIRQWVLSRLPMSGAYASRMLRLLG